MVDQRLLNAIGINAGEIGVHSVRKGAVTYCSSFPGGAALAPLFQRVGWSVGDVADVYLKYENGADQTIGRLISLLPYNDVRFAVLPPRFTVEYSTTAFEWSTIIKSYDNYTTSFKKVQYL